MRSQRRPISVDDIARARERISDLVRTTPVVPAAPLSAQLGTDVRLKLEGLQETGSFKVRGAANRLLQVREANETPEVITFSTGNHGRAVAHIGARLGARVTICVGEDMPRSKLDPLRATEAKVRVEGSTQDDAAEVARRLADERGIELIPPFDDEGIVAGQGTIGLELLDQVPDVAMVLVPVSGGGLIAGVALAIKSLHPGVRVVGVSALNCAAMWASQRAGKPVEFDESPTLADSLRGGIGLDNRITFKLVREHVDELVGVDENAIAAAMGYAARYEGLILEGAAVAGLAALLTRQVELPAGGPVVVLATGRNVGIDEVLRAVEASGGDGLSP